MRTKAAWPVLGLYIFGPVVSPVALAADLSGQLRNAAASGNLARLRQLVQSGVDVNAEDGKGRTALSLAAEKGRLEAVRLLRKAGAKPIMPSFLGAFWKGNTEVIQSSVEAMQGGFFATGLLNHALREASAQGRVNVVKLLLEYGADRSARDNNGRTALDHAKRYGAVEVVNLLAPGETIRFTKVEPRGFSRIRFVEQGTAGKPSSEIAEVRDPGGGWTGPHYKQVLLSSIDGQDVSVETHAGEAYLDLWMISLLPGEHHLGLKYREQAPSGNPFYDDVYTSKRQKGVTIKVEAGKRYKVVAHRFGDLRWSVTLEEIDGDPTAIK